MAGVLRKRGKFRHKDESKDRHMRTEAESRVVHLQAKKPQRLERIPRRLASTTMRISPLVLSRVVGGNLLQ